MAKSKTPIHTGPIDAILSYDKSAFDGIGGTKVKMFRSTFLGLELIVRCTPLVHLDSDQFEIVYQVVEDPYYVMKKVPTWVTEWLINLYRIQGLITHADIARCYSIEGPRIQQAN